jgi:hypothetical protein
MGLVTVRGGLRLGGSSSGAYRSRTVKSGAASWLMVMRVTARCVARQFARFQDQAALPSSA